MSNTELSKLIQARMASTGESYTVAKMLINRLSENDKVRLRNVTKCK